MGRPWVAGAGELHIEYKTQKLFSRDQTVGKGDVVTMDGSTGEVMLGAVATIQPQVSGDFAKLMVWADGIRRLKVRTNAETPADAEAARKFRSEEHTSELQSLMRNSYAVFCLNKKKK